MSSHFTVVQTNLNRAEFRWKWLRLLQFSSMLGFGLCLAALLIGGAILYGWLTSQTAALVLFGSLLVVGIIGWVVLVIAVLATSPDRSRLAAAVERIEPRFLDRLNTLLFLEKKTDDPVNDSFALRIARQTKLLITEQPPPSPFPATRALACLTACVIVLVATVMLYAMYAPWRLLAVPGPKSPAVAQKPLELALPATNNAEQTQSWGEVRITDPGADLKLTKVDVLPLQIEAAANQPLQQVDWVSAVNGAGEAQHSLPPPAEPRYAAYQPTLYLDEFNLSDWDVMTYYARASTTQTNSYASDLYFVEIRPFREDLLKLPGGQNGQAYRVLNEMSGLISRQQQVIRQTHQHLQDQGKPENLRAQDRKKLAGAETDLSDSTQHLYAQMASEMENKAIGEALDNLAKAKNSLARTGQLLEDNTMGEVPGGERQALSELVAARKVFQKTVTQNPGRFGEPPEGEPDPLANSQKLSQMAEFRDEAKATQEFVQKTIEQQRSLARQVQTAAHNEFPRLGRQEQQLAQSLADFQSQHPQAFSLADPAQAQRALAQAADSLQNQAGDARAATQNATRQLEQFDQALQERSAEQQLADAYKLKHMLDRQAQAFDQMSRPDSQASADESGRTAGEARQTVNQLRKVAEQEPTRDLFGQPLRDALSGNNKVDLDAKLDRLERARRLADAAERGSLQDRAAAARDALARVSKAFEQSQPGAMQAANQTDSLQDAAQDRFGQGLTELGSLLQQLEHHRQLAPEDQAKQGRQALFNLQTCLRSQYGDNEEGNQIMLHLEQLLKGETPLATEDLKKLMEELRHFSVETSAQLARKQDPPELTNIDPARLPPAYRGRIQKYFQKLSEK